jgi:predicted nucleotidyltransferase
MILLEKANFLLQKFKKWSESQKHIQGVAIVGSFAREEFRLDSDIDLVIISDNKEAAIQDILSGFEYDVVFRHQLEQWGPFLTSLRIFYDNGLEVEYGVTTYDWVKDPLDGGTKNVVKNGFKILIDKENVFSSVIEFLNEK